MDKTKSSKGVTKFVKHEKQILRNPQFHCVDKDKEFFKVEENDFPSLSEVREKNAEKDSLTSGVSLFSYSSKLKILPMECSSQNTKSENVQHGEGPTKNESSLNKAGSGKHLTKSQQANSQSFTQHPTFVPSSNKKSIHSKLNSSFSEVISKKPEYFNEHMNMKQSYGQKSVNDNRLIKTAHGESSSFEKMVHSSKKGFSPNNNTSNIQKPAFSKSLSIPKKTNTEYSSASRSERSYHRESKKPNTIAQHKRLDGANVSFRSNAGSDNGSRLSQVNAIQVNAKGNTSNKAKIANRSGSQMTYNSDKLENNRILNQSENVQASIVSTGETKRKKKRKSKLKRQSALQTGKILVLTPEAHSKIVNQSNNVYVQKNRNVLTNINDNEEYPELGAAEPKTIKENHVTETNIPAEGENSTNSVAFESETDSKKNVLVFKEASVNSDLEETANSEEKNNGPVGKPGSEKATLHSNNPFTLSLFDMLATAKPRKRESEKKMKPTDENTGKSLKKDIIKKNISQAVNPLASSKAATKRGKEREKPKIKRPSRMRKLILMERNLRKENIAMKRHEPEDANEEKPDEILPRVNISQDNLETCVEILEKILINPENSDSAFDICVDLDNKISEELLDYESDPPSTLISLGKISEKSKFENDIMNKTNHHVENHVPDIDGNDNECSNVSNSFPYMEKIVVLNPASSLTNKEDNFKEDSVNLNTVDNFSNICNSNIKNLIEKHSDLENAISDSCCMDENFMKNLKITENDSQTLNFLNLEQESDHKVIEDDLNTLDESHIEANIELNFGKKVDLPETKDSDRNNNSSENIVLNTSVNLFSDKERLKATKLMLHSRKFRQYCNHFISKEIDQAVFSLIDDLARFQDRMYQKDPVKAKIRRRLVYGIKEIKKHMKLKKVKCIIIATDIEDIKIEGGLNDALGELISLAEAYQIPCIFSHWRFNLGKVCRKSVPVSCVGIFNYEGSEKNFKKMIELQDDSKHDYLAITKKLATELSNDQVQELFNAEKESTLFLREVSQKILREMVYFTPEGYRNNNTSEDLGVVSTQQAEDSMSDEKSVSLIEKHSENVSQLNETDVNTILVKYKVVKEC